MDVGTADRDRPDLEQDVVVVDVWNRNFAELDGERLQRILHNSRLGGHVSGPHSNSGTGECKVSRTSVSRYSALSADSGSNRIACSVGRTHASAAVAQTIAAVATSASGSRGETSTSRLPSSGAESDPIASPNVRPTIVSLRLPPPTVPRI